MVQTTTLEREATQTISSDKLNAKLTEEVESILDAAESSAEHAQSKASQWSYRIPQAGVRIYSF